MTLHSKCIFCFFFLLRAVLKFEDDRISQSNRDQISVVNKKKIGLLLIRVNQREMAKLENQVVRVKV